MRELPRSDGQERLCVHDADWRSAVRVREIYLFSTVLAAGLVSCSDKTNPRVVTRLNDEAALVGELPSNPLRGKVITSWVNKKEATMSTRVGTEVELRYAGTN